MRVCHAFVGRSYDALCHLRLGRRRARFCRNAIRGIFQSPTHGDDKVGREGWCDLRHLMVLGLSDHLTAACDDAVAHGSTHIELKLLNVAKQYDGIKYRLNVGWRPRCRREARAILRPPLHPTSLGRGLSPCMKMTHKMKMINGLGCAYARSLEMPKS
jgi:hypothetical protein